MKFAFIIMGSYNSRLDRAAFHEERAQIIGVANLEEACHVAKELYEKGIGCIELCGAFGKEGAKKVIEATKNQVPIGYVTHLPEQDALFQMAFPKT